MLEWRPRYPIQQDSDASLDYYFDFTKYLAANPDIPGSTDDTIASVTYLTTGSATVVSIAQTTTSVQFRVSGVTEEQIVTVRLTMTSGNIDDFSLTFTPAVR